MKRALSIILAICLLGVAFVGCDKKEDTTTDDTTQSTAERVEDFDLEDKYTVVIKVKNYGDITAELYSDIAPITVKNFVGLVKAKFYDGLTFHRIIDGFMIQGGDPKGDGTGGSDENIKGEFALNGVENSLKHERGVLSMARSGSAYEQYLAMGYKLSDLPTEAKTDIERALNSASSQFFIMHKTTASLDGSYAAFGKVIEGMDIVDKIATETAVTDSNGTVLSSNQPVIESITLK